MGFRRFLKKSLIPGYELKSIVENVVTFGVVDGLKEEFKETYLEDMPGISHVYNAGKYDGKKEGYEKASNEYEKKLIKQADEFLKQEKVFEIDRARYEQLIDDYEIYIEEMMKKSNMSNEEKDYMNQIMVIERKLKQLK
ncbi:hypothetical protein P3F01_06160 [Clostridium perfringens]|uniref:hypothetical protein n=1 Tax=Clostridium perfringens TaxID=1502 RepID=UPI0013E37336|nr:hypothetical protein [Clostridium perfringens]MDK0783973.1 hypothetical protein [Clostridium perfringens]MDK0845036.1 hypothetical protein [Clostridium perfringens]MDT9335969.1 hypothetical protein [Clostridium perfringens]MDT9343725.1 hypothetical protein [Clostridium perfringens]MDT9346907.1 hypothetical protein [Clostridium perfringens]